TLLRSQVAAERGSALWGHGGRGVGKLVPVRTSPVQEAVRGGDEPGEDPVTDHGHAGVSDLVHFSLEQMCGDGERIVESARVHTLSPEGTGSAGLGMRKTTERHVHAVPVLRGAGTWPR